jgi:hypothetical protein
VHTDDCGGFLYCRMYSYVASMNPLLKFLSSDNDSQIIYHKKDSEFVCS